MPAYDKAVIQALLDAALALIEYPHDRDEEVGTRDARTDRDAEQAGAPLASHAVRDHRVGALERGAKLGIGVCDDQRMRVGAGEYEPGRAIISFD